MNSGIDPAALVLVAFLPGPRDLEIARLLGWYRIPLRRAPKVIEVDYLAFYQGSEFGEQHRWQVEWCAAVRGHELTTRGALLRDEPDHPRAAEEYYKVQLGPLTRLDAPIQAGRWKRMTFLYTTGELLQRAQTLRGLVVRDEQRNVLWRSLRERALRGGQYTADQMPEMPVDPALLAIIEGLSGLGSEF